MKKYKYRQNFGPFTHHRGFRSEVHFPRQGSGDVSPPPCDSWSERCLGPGLRGVVQQLREGRRLQPTPPGHVYFYDILSTVRRLDYEFNKLNHYFFSCNRVSRLSGTSIANRNNINISANDISYIDFAARSLIQLIFCLKQELTGQVRVVKGDSFGNSNHTNSMVSELENKLFDLLDKLAKFQEDHGKDCCYKNIPKHIKQLDKPVWRKLNRPNAHPIKGTSNNVNTQELCKNVTCLSHRSIKKDRMPSGRFCRKHKQRLGLKNVRNKQPEHILKCNRGSINYENYKETMKNNDSINFGINETNNNKHYSTECQRFDGNLNTSTKAKLCHSQNKCYKPIPSLSIQKPNIVVYKSSLCQERSEITKVSYRQPFHSQHDALRRKRAGKDSNSAKKELDDKVGFKNSNRKNDRRFKNKKNFENDNLYSSRNKNKMRHKRESLYSSSSDQSYIIPENVPDSRSSSSNSSRLENSTETKVNRKSKDGHNTLREESSYKNKSRRRNKGTIKQSGNKVTNRNSPQRASNSTNPKRDFKSNCKRTSHYTSSRKPEKWKGFQVEKSYNHQCSTNNNKSKAQSKNTHFWKNFGKFNRYSSLRRGSQSKPGSPDKNNVRNARKNIGGLRVYSSKPSMSLQPKEKTFSTFKFYKYPKTYKTRTNLKYISDDRDCYNEQDIKLHYPHHKYIRMRRHRSGYSLNLPLNQAIDCDECNICGLDNCSRPCEMTCRDRCFGSQLNRNSLSCDNPYSYFERIRYYPYYDCDCGFKPVTIYERSNLQAEPTSSELCDERAIPQRYYEVCEELSSDEYYEPIEDNGLHRTLKVEREKPRFREETSKRQYDSFSDDTFTSFSTESSSSNEFVSLSTPKKVPINQPRRFLRAKKIRGKGNIEEYEYVPFTKSILITEEPQNSESSEEYEYGPLSKEYIHISPKPGLTEEQFISSESIEKYEYVPFSNKYIRMYPKPRLSVSLKQIVSSSLQKRHHSRNKRRRRFIRVGSQKFKKSTERVLKHNDEPTGKNAASQLSETLKDTYSRGTSTEVLPLFAKRTSTTDLIRLIKAIGTNTDQVSKAEIGIDPIPLKQETPVSVIEVKSKFTNTEKTNIRSTGTDTIPEKEKPLVINTATDPLFYLEQIDKETNTAPEKKTHIKHVGTDPNPIIKIQQATTATDPLYYLGQKVKFTNTEPVIKTNVQTETPQKPPLATMGTLAVPAKVEDKITSYDKVKTSNKGTNPIIIKVSDKGLQFNTFPNKPEVKSAFTETYTQPHAIKNTQTSFVEKLVVKPSVYEAETQTKEPLQKLYPQVLKQTKKSFSEEIAVVEPDVPEPLVVKETPIPSELSMHLVFEKCEEETYKRRTNVCKPRRHTNCGHGRKTIVYENNRLNTLRLNSLSECNILTSTNKDKSPSSIDIIHLNFSIDRPNGSSTNNTLVTTSCSNVTTRNDNKMKGPDRTKKPKLGEECGVNAFKTRETQPTNKSLSQSQNNTSHEESGTSNVRKPVSDPAYMPHKSAHTKAEDKEKSGFETNIFDSSNSTLTSCDWKNIAEKVKIS